jgi:hypothetical protein
MGTPKQITLRNPSPALARRLKAISKKSGESLNTTVLRLLENAVGAGDRSEFLRTMPKWTDEESDDFDEALRAQRTIDDKLWR